MRRRVTGAPRGAQVSAPGVRSVICVQRQFERSWPYTADHWQRRWQESGDCELIRAEADEATPAQLISDPASVRRLVLLGFSIGDYDLDPFASLEECYLEWRRGSELAVAAAEARGVSFIAHRVDIYWGQTVAEYALAMTICGLRRIAQNHTAIQTSLAPWDYSPEASDIGPRGGQFGDDPRFCNGTVAGKRVRVVGVGNIGARYASWCAALGADVAVWDPFAPDASFVVAGAERRFHVEDLVSDAEIFVPMVPLTESTRGLITAELIDALPMHGLVVQVTRARVCDTEALYRRVLNDELALAADVFDQEPLPLDSPLLGRDNVVHTPHAAGRTRDANHAFADDAIARFKPR